MSVHSSDKTTVKAPKRYKEPEYKPFDVVKWLRSDSEYKTQPKHEIGPLEQGHNIKEYGPFIRNMDENVQELLDYSSPLDDIYEAQGGTDPYINTGLDLLGPAELAKIGLAGAKAGKAFDPSDILNLFPSLSLTKGVAKAALRGTGGLIKGSVKQGAGTEARGLVAPRRQDAPSLQMLVKGGSVPVQAVPVTKQWANLDELYYDWKKNNK